MTTENRSQTDDRSADDVLDVRDVYERGDRVVWRPPWSSRAPLEVRIADRKRTSGGSYEYRVSGGGFIRVLALPREILGLRDDA